jgi:hypothetical protein
MNIKDWLLEKLVAAERRADDNAEAYGRKHVEAIKLTAQVQQLEERIALLVPQKQYRVLLHGEDDGHNELQILAAYSSAGVTTLTVKE